MKAGILIITHPGIGQTMLDTATAIIGTCPIPCKVIAVPMDCDNDNIRDNVQQALQQLDQGEGVLILTDLYGATPSNLVSGLCSNKISIVTGLNLPMLIRTLNYPQYNLQQLTEKAVSGGHDGLLSCQNTGILS